MLLLTQSQSFIIGPIARLLGIVLNFIYSTMGIRNLGVCIILFTIFVYMLMLPLTIKQQKFSKLSSVMNPELQAIQKKYRNKKDQASMAAMQEETRAVYDKYGTSATGGCAQTLITFPLLFAFYSVIRNIPAYIPALKAIYENNGLVSAILGASSDVQQKFMEMLSASPISLRVSELTENTIVDGLWKFQTENWNTLATDILPNYADQIRATAADIAQNTKFLVYNISESPMTMIQNSFKEGNYLLIFMALLIPVLAGFTQWLNIRLMPQPATSGNGEQDMTANTMKSMNTFMPLFSVFICFSLAFGIGLYWITSAVIRSIQQIAINKYFDRHGLDEIIAKNQEKAAKKKDSVTGKVAEKARTYTRSLEADAAQQQTGKGRTVLNGKDVPSVDMSGNTVKAGSLAEKANMVRRYNENNGKKGQK